ncbi:hypothetical protein RF11_01829 [Thelohanellus kitauei]|uniref:Uncharacterized protein n=1 Tax=Thelohanellus kitauei TaxID=669202 RepID=A0A0C2ICN5_THEKT|nr:hypothetical protein RF11_01829 [Thelohanellus kitauei]
MCEYLPIFYLNLAHVYLKLSDINRALEMAHKGLEYNFSLPSLMRLIGYLNDILCKHEEAQLWYHRALSFSPQLVDLIPKSCEFSDYTTIPPETNYRTFRQQDVFCTEMMRYSM